MIKKLHKYGLPDVKTPWSAVIVANLIYLISVPLYPFYHAQILDWCVRYQIKRSWSC